MTTNTGFENSFISVLDKQAPKKIKKITRESKTSL